MLELGSFEDARRKVLANSQRLLLGVKRAVAEPIESVDAGLAVLASLRRQAHDGLIHIQRDQMIICAAEWLMTHGVASPATCWHWNPRSSTEPAAPDLIGRDGDAVTICAEVAASEEPVGVIDAQMRRALAKLASMDGRRFYFVRSVSMKRRAASKVIKAGWDIAVVQIALLTSTQPTPAATPMTSLAAVGAGSPR
jgi:hypothetical protein